MYFMCSAICTGLDYAFDCAKNTLPQIIPSKNSPVRKVCEKTTEIGNGIFQGIIPHLINISPMYLSRMTNLRIFSTAGLLYIGWDQLVQPYKNWRDTATSVRIVAIDSIVLADMFGFIPPQIEYHIAVNIFVISATAIGSSCAIYAGIRRMISSWSANEGSTTSRVSDFTSGLISVLTGIGSLPIYYREFENIVYGTWKFRELDPGQKYHVLKNRAVGSLGKEKSCTAVIFDGMAHSEKFLDNVVSPIAENIYENCETRSYTVNTPNEFCDALENAKNHFNKSISIVVFDGHADTISFYLGKTYRFYVGLREVRCMNDFLSSEAQIFLAGCNTATPSSYPSLTERLSKKLLGKEVNGYSSYYHPGCTLSSYIKGRFHHDNFYPMSSAGWVNPFFSSLVTFNQRVIF